MVVKNAGSRLFHGVMVVPCAVLCLIAIISFGTFASTHDKIRKESDKFERHHPEYRLNRCILFAKSGVDPITKKEAVFLSEGHACVLAIWGEVFVAFLALLLGVVFVVKAAIGLKA